MRFLNHFDFHGHICIVFELLGCSLYDVLKAGEFKGLPLATIRTYASQIFDALDFLRGPGVNIVHCDLKPENILICRPGSTNIKLVDFGSSCIIGRTVGRRFRRSRVTARRSTSTSRAASTARPR